MKTFSIGKALAAGGTSMRPRLNIPFCHAAGKSGPMAKPLSPVALTTATTFCELEKRQSPFPFEPWSFSGTWKLDFWNFFHCPAKKVGRLQENAGHLLEVLSLGASLQVGGWMLEFLRLRIRSEEVHCHRPGFGLPITLPKHETRPNTRHR